MYCIIWFDKYELCLKKKYMKMLNKNFEKVN